jgi:nucleotidyltransferase/DNA polymerase involved in DNA repair
VVATYVARAYGVHSGMPMQHAFRKCPDAVFLPNDHPAYDAASAGVMEVMRSFGHPVGVWDWDEAYLGAGCDDPEELARAVRTAVHDHTALTGAVGIGDTNEPANMPAWSRQDDAWGACPGSTSRSRHTRLLEVSAVHSLAGFNLSLGCQHRRRGQRMATPGAISCGHKGVLFLDDSTEPQSIRCLCRSHSGHPAESRGTGRVSSKLD